MKRVVTFFFLVGLLMVGVCSGFLFAQAYLLYNKLWLPLGIHFAWHFAARTLGSTGVPASEAAILVTEVKGPTLLVVTKAGGASVFELVGVAVVSLIIWFMSKKSKALKNI